MLLLFLTFFPVPCGEREAYLGGGFFTTGNAEILFPVLFACAGLPEPSPSFGTFAWRSLCFGPAVEAVVCFSGVHFATSWGAINS